MSTTPVPISPVAGAHPSGRLPRSLGRAVGLLPLLLATTVLIVGFVWPLITVLLRSLSPDGAATLTTGVTLDHYAALVANNLLRQVTGETFSLAVYATALTLLLGFPTAYLMSRLPRGMAFAMLALITIPFWVSILLRLFSYTIILGREGIINTALGWLGIGPLELMFTTQATVLGMMAYLLPYMVLLLYAAMVSVDNSLVTAAKTMGASGRQAFLHIYFPQIRAAVVSGVALVFVIALSFYLTPAILGGPSNLTLSLYIQQQVSNFDWATASAAGICLGIVSVIGYAVAFRIGGANVLGGGGRPVGRGVVAREPLRLSVSTVLSWICAGIVLLILLVPILITFPASFGATNQILFPPRGFTTDWYIDVLTDPVWISAFAKSVIVGLGTAVLATVMALAFARAATTVKRGWVRALISATAFAPLVVPGILLAIGIYDVQLRLGAVGTDWGLILAHSVLALPFAYVIIFSTMSRLDGSLEAAAWSMGASPIRAYFTVVMPNLVPALVGAAVISFMSSFDEVIVALFQTGLDKTLPVVIFSLVKGGVTPGVGAVAVLLTAPVIVGVIVFLLISRRRGNGVTPSSSSVEPIEDSTAFDVTPRQNAV